MLTSSADLEALCRRVRRAGRVALDTEFFWERTYYPQLGVVQIGLSHEDVHLVDALALPDLPGLGGVLSDPDTEVILHDACQDLQILARRTGAYPCRVFDTRRAAGFGGLTSTMSLSRLVADVLDVHLPKDETRSNWLQRPLSDRQGQYACDDVRYLPALRDRLCDRASERGNETALREEMAVYDDPSLYDDTTPDTVYRRLNPVRQNPAQRALLYALVCWREETARRLDRPRRHVFPDAELRLLALHAPLDPDALASVRGISRQLLCRYEPEIRDLAVAAMRMDPAALPSLPDEDARRLSSGERDRIHACIAAARQRALHAGIDPALLGSKAELLSVFRHHPPGSLSLPGRRGSGWRDAFLMTP